MAFLGSSSRKVDVIDCEKSGALEQCAGVASVRDERNGDHPPGNILTYVRWVLCPAIWSVSNNSAVSEITESNPKDDR